MKNSIKFAPALTGVLLAATALAAPAHAAGWAVWEGQNEAAPRVIYTDAADTTGAMLACDAKGDLTTLLTLEPSSVPEVMKLNAPYYRGTESKVTVGNGEPATATFRYRPARKTIESAEHSTAAKVYNSVVKGEALKVETKREGSVEMTLPPADETFKSFARTCRELRTAIAS